MEFKKFLKMWLDTSDGAIVKMSKYKHENEEEYSKYRQRVKQTEDYYYKNRSRSLQEGKPFPELTEKNYFDYEKYAESSNALLGK
jgi:hypothetical protein